MIYLGYISYEITKYVQITNNNVECIDFCVTNSSSARTGILIPRARNVHLSNEHCGQNGHDSRDGHDGFDGLDGQLLEHGNNGN